MVRRLLIKMLPFACLTSILQSQEVPGGCDVDSTGFSCKWNTWVIAENKRDKRLYDYHTIKLWEEADKEYEKTRKRIREMYGL